jgi:hypothetical protein
MQRRAVEVRRKCLLDEAQMAVGVLAADDDVDCFDASGDGRGHRSVF